MKKTVVAIALFFSLNAHAQTINTIAGKGATGTGGDGGAATAAEMNYPAGVAADGHGNVYIADRVNNKIRKISPAGIITTFAGTGIAGYTGDGGQAATAQLYQPSDIAIGKNGDVYVADIYNNAVRRISTNGIISTFAGGGSMFGDGGPATNAVLSSPTGLAIDTSGNVYIADFSHNRVRVVNTSGIISTFAGNGVATFGGDHGQATAAQLFNPSAIATDKKGNVFIAEQANYRVRMVNAAGVITTLAGLGTYGPGGDGDSAWRAQFMTPWGLAVDGLGNVYIADEANNRVRRVNTHSIIGNFTGTGIAGFEGDAGTCGEAKLSQPGHMAFDSLGNLYIADQGNFRVRKITGINTAVEGQLANTLPGQINIYPNPNYGTFTLELTGATQENLEAIVYDVLGKAIATQYFTYQNGKYVAALDLVGFAPGFYLVKALDGADVYWGKVIVK